MKILVVEPQKEPYVKDVENSLKSLQQIVGGYIEAIYPFDEKVALVCNEEGKLDPTLKWNRVLFEISDIIKGTFFICGIDECDFTDISDEYAEKFTERFKNPEMIIGL